MPDDRHWRRSLRAQTDHLSITTVTTDLTHAQVEIAGELDLASSPALATILSAHLEAGRIYTTVDLAAVTFLDAGAIGTLVQAHNAYGAARGSLLLRHPPDRALRLFVLLNLDAELLIASEPPDMSDVAN